MLPAALELWSDAAPRFWTPADPVIIVKNCGLPTKHQFPRPLPCRLPGQVVTAAETVVSEDTRSFGTASGISEVAAALQKHFSQNSEILASLLNEGSIVEQAITDLAQRSLPPAKQFNSESAWHEWTERLRKDLTLRDDPNALPTDHICVRQTRRSHCSA